MLELSYCPDFATPAKRLELLEMGPVPSWLSFSLTRPPFWREVRLKPLPELRPNPWRAVGISEQRTEKVVKGHVERGEFDKLAQAHSEEALLKLVDLMRHSMSETIQYKAAQAILDRAWSKPAQQVNVGAEVSGAGGGPIRVVFVSHAEGTAAGNQD